MSLILKQENSNAVPTPASGKGAIFLNTNDEIVVKQSDGNTVVVPSLPSIANTAVFYSDNGSFAGSTEFTFDNTSNALTVTGEITGSQFNGSGAGLTDIVGANVTGTVANATYATSAGSATSATTAGTVTTASQPNITSVGTLAGLTANSTVNFTDASNVSLGNVGNVHILGGSADYVLSTDGSGALTWVAPPSATSITNGNSNVSIASSGGNITASVNGNANIVVVTGTGANVNGTLDVSGVITGNGSGLTAIAGANVTGAVSSATSATTAGTVTTASQPNITGVGTLVDLSVSGNAVIGGNLTVDGNLVYVNVTDLSVEDPIIQLQTGPNGAAPSSNSGKDIGTALNYYDSAAKVAFMGWDVSNAEFGFGNVVSISGEVVTFTNYGNVRAGYFIGNGSQLTDVAAATATTADSATTSGTVTTAAQPNITSVGTLTDLTSGGNIDFTTGSNISLGDISNIHIDGGNANYVLSTDGAGNLSWAAQSGGGSSTTIVIDSFTGDGANTDFILSATPSSEDYTIVGIAGTMQPKSTYAVSGATLSFSEAPPDGAPIEITTFTAVELTGSNRSIPWDIINANTELTVFTGYFVDTSSSALTVTLPSVASLGDTIRINDLAGTAATNNITVFGNGKNIQGSSANLIIDYNNTTVDLVYSDSTYGWKAMGL